MAVASPKSVLGNVNALTSPSSGFFVTDLLSGRKFLVDTGAFRSLFPATAEDRISLSKHPSNLQLIAANGSPIPTYGTRTIPIQAAERSFSWDFIIADVKTPLLGADFLGHYELLVDVANRKLLDVATFHSTPLGSHSQGPEICSVRTNTPYDMLTQKFLEVFRPELRHKPGEPAKHGILHYIKTTGAPVYSKFRRLSPEKLQAAKQAYADMERMGVCQKASSPWASPLHLVKKADGTWRPCGDYRRLNLATEPDHYPLPNMADVTCNLHGAKVFSKLDLLKGYFQVPVAPEDIPKTAVITPFGSYTFNYSTFGLRNSGATFQRLMDGILGDLPFCACYVDDILVFSRNTEEHIKHLQTVLQRLLDNGLVVRQDKCHFGVTSVEFLGHLISPAGVSPLPDKVNAVVKFPPPTTIKGLQEFVGMVNYYHRFLPKIAKVMEPLYKSLSGKPKTLEWGPTQQEAFEATKTALASATTLSYPYPGSPLTLTTDASSVAVGAVIEQTTKGTTQPLGFFSRKLRQAEARYSTFDRELLAVYLAVRHFKHLLEGSQFTIRTDHKPLVHAFSKPGDAWSNRQQRQLSSIAEFNCTIEYTPGRMNPVADALSRVEINSVHLGINYDEVATAQETDQETAAYRTAITSLEWKDVEFGDSGRTIICDISTGRPRPLIPKAFRRRVFDIVHSLSHPSGRSTAQLLKEKFVWHGMNKNVKNWARDCIVCQTSKIGRHIDSGTGAFSQPKRRFGHLHVDVVGPLPPSDGAQYLFTTTERSTRWPEAIPMTTATARDCAEALLHGWISRFGVPDDITSDRGPAFTSQLWKSLGELMGATVHYTTAYNPAANGMVERTHRTLKAALMARCTGPDWRAQLPWVLLGIRTSPKEGLRVSPAEMVYGEPLVVPGEFFPSSDTAEKDDHLARLRQTVGKYSPCIKTHKSAPPGYVPKSLDACKFVFVRNDAHRPPLTRPYRGPYAILERNPKAFRLSVAGRTDWVSIDRLKPAYVEEGEPTLAPPLVEGQSSMSDHLSAPPLPQTTEDGPQPASSRTGRLIRRPNRLNL